MSRYNISILAFLALSFSFFSYEYAFAQNKQKTVTITCELTSCQPDFALYQFNGFTFDKIAVPEKTKINTYVFKLPKSRPATYHIGAPSKQLSPILLGSEDGVIIKGECSKVQSAKVENSPLNDKYQVLKKTFRKHDLSMRRLVGQLSKSGNDKAKAAEIVQEIGVLDQKKVRLIDSLKQEAPFLSKVAAVNTYTSYFHYGKDFSNEVEYFANNFFQFADFSDSDYNNITYVYESFRNYSETMCRLNLSKEQHLRYLTNMLNKIPEGTKAYDYAVGGMISGLKKKNHPNMVVLGNQVIENAPDKNDPKIVNLRQQIDRAKSFMPGAPAPDFSQPDPYGKNRRLSDLKGKVVLIDFWASWCGPSRRENPNVVKLYNKYKDQGFEILGVSLDKDKKRWMAAIEKDQLDWWHVSDLKGWKNSVAQSYGVSSIPHTVLVDEEGNIIARNLRGPKLEHKLAEVFGK